jgi:3-hydroxy acid dehydrogenase / malonic semialdehyde reductase
MRNKKLALITGASSGFGKAFASTLAEAGFNLILLARRESKLMELKNEILSKYPETIIYIIITDVRDYSGMEKLLLPILEENKIDLLINNAGLASGLSDIVNGDIADWDLMLDTNVKGLLYVTKLILPFMQKQNSGHIINISSIAGKEVYPKGNVYCASKHAVEAISKALRKEVSQHNIKITTINPGAANTEFSLVRFKGDKEKADTVYKGFEPLSAEDIAETVRWIVTLPSHVNINELVIMPSAQPEAGLIHKNM